MSVELKLEPMWPEPACMIMKSVLMRHRSAINAGARDRIAHALAHRAERIPRDKRQRVVSDQRSADLRNLFRP